MGIFTRKNNETDEMEMFFDYILKEKQNQLNIKKFAIEHAIDLIAKTISKCEIKYYRYDSTKKKVIEDNKCDTYYKLNIKPNKNEAATSFFYMVISSLLREKSILLITLNEQLYFSKKFEVTEYVTKENKYSNIELINSFGDTESINKTISEKDVIRMSYENCNIRKVIEDYFDEYETLLNASSSNFIYENIQKYRLKIPGNQPAMKDPVTKADISYDDYKKKIADGLFDKQEALIILSEFFGLERINGDRVQTSEDYRNLVKKWSDDVAVAFNIPLDVFYGSKTDKSTGTNDFITFAINPIIEMIEDNLNAKLILKDNYLKGEKFVINKLNIKHFDIFDVAGPIDKLSANGFSHNDNRSFLGLPTVAEDWANEHRFTKNYAELKGGDE